MVVEVSFLGWTEDKLLRHVVFEGVRHDDSRHRKSVVPYLWRDAAQPFPNRSTH